MTLHNAAAAAASSAGAQKQRSHGGIMARGIGIISWRHGSIKMKWQLYRIMAKRIR